MASSPSPLPVLLVLSAVVSGAVAAVVTLAVATPSAEPAPTVQQAVDLTPVLARLDELSRRLDEVPMGASRPVATEREPASVSAASTSIDLSALEAVVERLEKVELRAGGYVGMVEKMARMPREVPVNSAALIRLASLTKKEARRELTFVSAEEVLNLYGSPTDVTVGNNRVRWIYTTERDAPRRVDFVFGAGRVESVSWQP